MNLQKGYLKYAFRPSTPCLQSDSVSQEHMYIYKKKRETEATDPGDAAQSLQE